MFSEVFRRSNLTAWAFSCFLHAQQQRACWSQLRELFTHDEISICLGYLRAKASKVIFEQMADTVATNSILPFHYCNSRSFVFSRKWLVETELADTLEEQYFIAQTAGKSWPKGEAKIAKNFGQK